LFIQIFNIAMYILALYGIISLIMSYVRHLWRGSGIKHLNTNMRMVLIAKDQEDVIEGIIRSLYISGVSEGGAGIYVVDADSQDKTLEILQKLNRTYDNMRILAFNERDRIFDGFIEDIEALEDTEVDIGEDIEDIHHIEDLENIRQM